MDASTTDASAPTDAHVKNRPPPVDAALSRAPRPIAPLSSSWMVGNAVVLRWQGAGDGTVSIEITNGAAAGADRATIRCVVKDDGCHAIPASLVTWLRAGRADTEYSVVLRRAAGRSAVLDSVDGGARAVFSLAREARGKVLP